MRAAVAPAESPSDRAEQLRQLRRQMAAVSGKVGSGWRAPDPAGAVATSSESLLPVPESLAGLLPGGLPRGTVTVLSGARSLAVGLVASVTAAGGNVSVVGLPDFGLLAAAEMGADLSRIAVIPNPGTDPVEVAAVLTDGMDLVVLGLAGRSVPVTRARAVMARARQRGCALLVTHGDWQGASLRMHAQICGYEIAGGCAGRPGRHGGRISKVRVSVRVR
ncbi:MAG: hypothetical protein KDB50_12795 [Mycobacterium sp.]|nr:hypothetical protein [Mycobacterium sp.]